METTSQSPSYQNTAIQYALVLAIVASAVGIMLSYRFIGAEPSGSPFAMIPMQLVPCLFFMLGGLLVVKKHVQTHNLVMKAGKAAVVGLVTGLYVAAFASVISLVWNFVVDPGMMDAFRDAAIANFEAIQGMPDDAKAQMIDGMYEQFEKQASLSGQIQGIGIGLLFSGILNLITGIIAAAIWARKEEVL